MTGSHKRSKSPTKPSARPAGSTAADPLVEFGEAVRGSGLVVLIGTGVSMGLTDNKLPTLSWKRLIENGFAYGVARGKITAAQADAWKPQLASSDLDDLLGAAEFVGRKLESPRGDMYERWLNEVFRPVRATNRKLTRALRAVAEAGIPICTLNYDPLLEQATGLPAITLRETSKVTEWMRRERSGILHLHGSFDSPETCILGIRDYETTLGNEVRDLIQRSLSAFSRLLFIGCGSTFVDPNFSALIKWLRSNLRSAAPKHYALVRESEVASRLADSAWHGFVDPLSYGAEHKDLADFLRQHVVTVPPAATKKKGSLTKTSANSVAHDKVISAYRAFLIKDCGKMTIEGVRADMDTAQRRFDIERLFVPLTLLPCRPEESECEPNREAKMLRWEARSREAVAFGKLFEEHPKLALLALPGGGKTMLLKRLAVAYADPARRSISSDDLPDLDVVPVLLRCREWREYIDLPLATLLRRLPEITGQGELTGLFDALLPLFKLGRILLLVDGLDEIHDDARRSIFVKHLESFLIEYPDIRLVVTSREAGFSLVAPHIARFCERWRVAPLPENSIFLLCDYWHRLMKGDSEAVRSEGKEVADRLLHKDSLRRLAENPLLLTMLLVVKHGSGRLPPDRVMLYERAVEVLLDTWNIEGHAPLSIKEAVPQLAYVAFQLMCAGKQTATEKELIGLLEEAREKVPQIGRYAKDPPHEFLKRVELRSSLLIEAGHQAEAGRTVPFYQFRHLTFQEYLAAVAAFAGHYPEYSKGDTVLTPLAPHLLADEWKEVIPMAAVLAGKQAEPLMAALVADGQELREEFNAKEKSKRVQEWLTGITMPNSVARLVQCLMEEAQAAPETLTAALQVVVLFAGGLRRTNLDWSSLCRGPYGDELLHQSWLLFESMNWPEEARIDFGVVAILKQREPDSHWLTPEALARVVKMLHSTNHEEIGQGLGACVCLMWKVNRTGGPFAGIEMMREPVERYLFHDSPALYTLASWVWGLLQKSGASIPVTPKILDRLMRIILESKHPVGRHKAAWAIAKHAGMARDVWQPILTEGEAAQLMRMTDDKPSTHRVVPDFDESLLGIYTVAFHAKAPWLDIEIKELLLKNLSNRATHRQAGIEEQLESMLKQLGEDKKQSILPIKAADQLQKKGAGKTSGGGRKVTSTRK